MCKSLKSQAERRVPTVIPTTRAIINIPKVIKTSFIILLLLAGCAHKPPPLDRGIVIPHLNTDKPGMVVK